MNAEEGGGGSSPATSFFVRPAGHLATGDVASDNGRRRVRLLTVTTTEPLGRLQPDARDPVTTTGRAPVWPAAAAPGPTGSGRRRLSVTSLAIAVAVAWLVWTGLSTLRRSGGIGAGLAAGRAELLAPSVLLLVVAVLVCERCWPAEPRVVTSHGHLQDGLYFALHVAAVVPLMTLLSVAFAYLLGSHAGRLEPTWTARWPSWLVVPVALVLMDGSNWLAHWADHRFTALWRMHALHHSQEELSVLTSFRAHPLSHLPGFLLAALPVWLLMGGRGLAPVLVTTYVCLGTLPHANLPWSFGPFGRLLVSPAYHRLHHAADGTEGTNLGVVLTIWDVIAGRARFPEKGDVVPRTGLAGGSVPTEQASNRGHLGVMVTQLAEPFMVQSGTGPGRSALQTVSRVIQARVGASTVLSQGVSGPRRRVNGGAPAER